MGCGDRSVAFFKEHPSSSERSLSKRKGRWSSAEGSRTQWNPKHQPKTKSKRNSKREVDGLSNTYIKQYETDVERKDRWSSARKPSTRWNPKQKSQNLVEKKRWPRCWWTVKCGSRCHKRNFFSMWSSVVYIRRQRICDEDDHQRQKEDDETCVPHPQSCVRLVVWLSPFGPKIQMKCVDTKNQLADMLTKGSFTRDDWNHLFRAPILFQLKSRAPRRRELRKEGQKKHLWWRNQSQ